MAGSEMVTQEVLIVLKIPKGGTKKDLKDIKVTVKTESGEEIPVLNLSEPNYTGAVYACFCSVSVLPESTCGVLRYELQKFGILFCEYRCK